MKKNHLLSAILIGFFFAGCSGPKESTGVWVNKEKIQGKSFNNIFIVVMTANIQARVKLEKDLEAVAISKGYKAVKSIDVLPSSLDDPKAPSKDEIVSKVKASGCDAVFVAALLKKEEDVRYTPGSTAYSVQPYYTYYGGYYNHWSPSVYTPSYYEKGRTYFMVSNLYDAASEEIMWSVQSEVFDPSSLERFSTVYTASLLKQLEKQKLLKK